ncbi:AraC family transcriptional regulator [Flaviaesturariibacter flavus]|uniref:AraC family transcriptional regulator n=1 Tax=Flaviaesturariibacter flavus TaxID=2502780 RepID=A0A4R1B810_9BACT|nr:AraC family transcriptional regulator [Flaviaesturariibacter flavus]TCJ12103.1 AraC family transcriptional regulator [Flaviaesturariibacter flavus]
MAANETKISRIMSSCYTNMSHEGEHFIPDHRFILQVSGELTVQDGRESYVFGPGHFRFSRRNHLARFVKQPPAGGAFEAFGVLLDQETLRRMSHELGLQASGNFEGPPMLKLEAHELYGNYFRSLQPYLDMETAANDPLLEVKVREAVLILLRTQPWLKDVLFDFTEPGKINLEEFMHSHFHFNVSMERFAYLTGRSLATFKRDFEKTFHTTPSRWLQQKRLEQAWHLIHDKRRKPSDVYLEVGFEDLSHFSFAFKKAFGTAPSRV